MLDIKKELVKNSYAVFMNIIDENTYNFSYPAMIFPNKIEKRNELLYIEKDIGIKYKVDDNEPILIEIDEYAYRPFIIGNIAREVLIKRKYKRDYMICLDENGKDIGVDKFLEKIPVKSDFLGKESVLNAIYIKGYLNNFPDVYRKMAEDAGVLQSYLTLQKVSQGEVK